MTAQEALQRYYGYDNFRGIQAEVIERVLRGQDTLALMPTGGGKSLCFQIPTLVTEGLCLVVTPLIALMKDQVENLRRRDIRAACIYSGMTYTEIETVLDNCQYGPYRFLYVSPERLESESFRIRLSRLPVTLIAVDEAHCISQWGYDFRPAYLHIASIRERVTSDGLGTRVPVLALTATATPAVTQDICLRLSSANELSEPEKTDALAAWQVFRQSFHRDNLSYIVRRVADNRAKDDQLIHILSRVPGSAIVYVRNRKRTEELSQWLTKHGLSANFYHAGLSNEERSVRQQAWKAWTTDTPQDKGRIMVCTNAFGMGIDKADVRLVIHYDLPDAPEAYFQEAGRAGRDGKTAYAVLLYAPEDKTKLLKRVGDNYPPREFVERVYNAACDYFCVGIGSGRDHSFALHIEDLCRVMHLPILTTYSALHLLSQAGYIHFEDEQDTEARVKINVSREMLGEYAISQPQQEMLQMLMRNYTGIFTDLQYLRFDPDEAQHHILAELAARHIVTYIPRARACLFQFTQERQDEAWLPRRIYEQRRDQYVERLKAMMEYAENTRFCREQLLLHYFGEEDADVCQRCDVCRSRAKGEIKN